MALGLVLATLCSPACRSGGERGPTPAPAEVISNAQVFGSLYLAGQPARAELERLAQAGVVRVVNLRKPGEFRGFDERACVEGLGLEYIELPFGSPQELSDELLDRGRALIAESARSPTLLHCASGNRAGVLWLAYRALDPEVSWSVAQHESKRLGMKSPAYEQRVKAYVEAREQ